MSTDFQIAHPCPHMLMEEPVVLGADRKTIQLKAPIANTGAALLLVNDQDYIPSGGLYSPAQIYAARSGPYRIQRCAGTLGPANNDITIKTNAGVITIPLPVGSPTTQEVIRTIKAATTLVAPVSVRGVLVLTELNAVGSASYIRLSGKGAATLGFSQLGGRGRELYPPWTFASTTSVYPAVNGPLRGYVQRVWQPQFTRPLRSNPTLKVTYTAPPTQCPRCNGTYVENDYRFDVQGDPVTITGANLLYQACMKAILTRKGSNPYHPTYGCRISGRVGAKQGSGEALLMKADVMAALKGVQDTQMAQGKYQRVPVPERLAAIVGVDVRAKSDDPTVFIVSASIMSGSRQPVALSIVFTVPGAVALAGSNGKPLGVEVTGQTSFNNLGLI